MLTRNLNKCVCFCLEKITILGITMKHDAAWKKKDSERSSAYKSYRWYTDPEWRQRYKERESLRWRTCLTTRLMNYKRRKHRDFALTDEQAMSLFQSPCHYCGVMDPVLQSGIDRVHNDVHYTVDNSVSCCQQCNTIKHKRPVKDFLAHVHRIHEFQVRDVVH